MARGLENILREIADGGNFSHLSILSSGGGFHASFSPAAAWGSGHGFHRDPVEAAVLAIDNAPKGPKNKTPLSTAMRVAAKTHGIPVVEVPVPRTVDTTQSLTSLFEPEGDDQ